VKAWIAIHEAKKDRKRDSERIRFPAERLIDEAKHRERDEDIMHTAELLTRLQSDMRAQGVQC
jgi:hypothetical protein